MASELTRKVPPKFECAPCDFSCYNRKDYKRHLCTRKHMGIPKTPAIFACDICNLVYKHRSRLCKHKKKCTPQPSVDLHEIVSELVQSNLALQKQMAELCSRLNSPHVVL